MADYICIVNPKMVLESKTSSISVSSIFRSRTSVLAASCMMIREQHCCVPLSRAGQFAAASYADMTIMETLDRGNIMSVFSKSCSNTSQHFLFSRDPAYVSNFDDFIRPFQFRDSRSTYRQQPDMIYHDSPSEGTFFGERFYMNSTRTSLAVHLIKTRPMGHMRERKDLHRRVHRYR